MFEEISNCGIGLVQRQQQAANHKAESLKKQSTVSMKLFRESNRKMKLLEEREGHACLTELLEFWALCLCASELITAKNIVCTNAKSGKSNQSFHDASDSQEKYMEKHGLVVVSEGSKNKETKIHVTELPLNCLGQSNLLAIIGCVCSTVMALRDSYKDYLSVKSSSCPSDVYNRLQNSLLPISLWRKVIQVLTVIQGPVHEDGFNSRDLACMTPGMGFYLVTNCAILMFYLLDGCLTIAASKVIKCQDQARGLPQVLLLFHS